MAQVYVTGEPAGTWDDATGVSGKSYTYEVDVTGITDMETLDQYMRDQNCIPYAILPGGDGFGPGKVYLKTKYDQEGNSPDEPPIVSGTISLGGVFALDPITGGADLGTYTTLGFFSKLSHNDVVNAILRAMFVSLDAAQLMDDFKQDINNSLSAYEDENGDVPIYVDENGAAFVLAEMVEAVRAKMVELGVYGEGEYSPQPFPASSTVILGDSVDPGSVLNFYNEWNLQHGVTSRFYSGVYNGLTAAAQMCRTESGVDDGTFLLKYCTPPNQALLEYFPNVKKGSVYPVRGDFGSRKYCGYLNETGIIKKQINGSNDGSYSISVDTSRTETAFNLYNFSTLTRTISYDSLICTGTSVAPVSGVTPSADIPANFTDLSIGIDGVLPDWWQKRKALAVPRARGGSQAADDIYSKSPALPLDIPSDLVLEDGYAGDFDDTIAGDISDTIKGVIVDSIPIIIEEIIEEIGDPTIPDIPVSDTGDTPPAIPPVISGSGSNGSNGLWSFYNPSMQDVQDFGAWLWSENLADQFARIFSSPIDGVIGFHMIYCTPTKGSPKAIKCGFLTSPVTCDTIANQYAEINCGTIHVHEFYHTVLDYTATRLNLYLPFIGIVPLDTAVCMDADIQVIYRIDVLTGTCLAQVKVIKQNSNAVMYTFPGNCSVQVPLTASTFTGMVSTLVGLANTAVGIGIGSPAMVVTGAKQAISGVAERMGTGGIKQSGSLGSNAGVLGIRIPYLVITHPVAYDAFQYSAQYGYPLNQTITLGSVTGFTKVKDIHLQNIPCTDDELEQIETLLKEGVIIN